MQALTEFLTKEELTDLTGYRQKKRQIEWLKQHHFAIQDENKYKPLVLYKDVFGQPRHQLTSVQPKSKWQPPAYLTGAKNGQTTQAAEPVFT